MPKVPIFKGFPKEAVRFFNELKFNNDKLWFDDHRAVYEEYVLGPSRDYVAAMGAKLAKIAPGIVADPRINKSLFRINRDARFSKDKSPYKTHMGIWLWEGPFKRMENSGFYFHLDPPHLLTGVGVYMFPKELLQAYRESVVHPQHGPALVKAIAAVGKHGLEVGGKHYKRVPRDFDPNHKYAELLKHNGLVIGIEEKIPAIFHKPEFIDFQFDRFKKMLPLHKWLLELTRRMV
jgi:uncharacterized protein (TIGR02453 family)